MKKILVLLFCLGLVGCATTAKYEALLNTWVGYSENSLIASWGAPQNSYQMANGDRVIEYIRGGNIPMGGYTYTQPQTTYHYGQIGNYGYHGTSTQYVTKTTPVYNIPIWCKTSFIIGSDGRIRQWRWEGNNCVSNYKPDNSNDGQFLSEKAVTDYYKTHKDIPGKGIPWQDAPPNP